MSSRAEMVGEIYAGRECQEMTGNPCTSEENAGTTEGTTRRQAGALDRTRMRAGRRIRTHGPSWTTAEAWMGRRRARAREAWPDMTEDDSAWLEAGLQQLACGGSDLCAPIWLYTQATEARPSMPAVFPSRRSPRPRARTRIKRYIMSLLPAFPARDCSRRPGSRASQVGLSNASASLAILKAIPGSPGIRPRPSSFSGGAATPAILPPRPARPPPLLPPCPRPSARTTRRARSSGTTAQTPPHTGPPRPARPSAHTPPPPNLPRPTGSPAQTSHGSSQASGARSFWGPLTVRVSLATPTAADVDRLRPLMRQGLSWPHCYHPSGATSTSLIAPRTSALPICYLSVVLPRSMVRAAPCLAQFGGVTEARVQDDCRTSWGAEARCFLRSPSSVCCLRCLRSAVASTPNCGLPQARARCSAGLRRRWTHSSPHAPSLAWEAEGEWPALAGRAREIRILIDSLRSTV